MTQKEKFRLDVAHWLEKRFPNRFCWAGLVTWAYSVRPFWTIIHEWNDNRGCQKDGEATACYCGKYGNEEYFKPDDLRHLIQCPQCQFDWSAQEIENQECLVCGHKVFDPLPF